MLNLKNVFNKDLMCAGLNQLWRIISGPITMVLIPFYLTPEMQGYWYIFISLSALAIFADLGFSNIILQFAAHEFAYLKFDSDGLLYGDEEHLKRIASFFRFSVKWLTVITLIAFPAILIGGHIYLSTKITSINWETPWFIYSFCSGIAFFYSSLLCFFEGCNSVSMVQLIRFKISILTSCTLILCLVCNFQLYALAFSLLCSTIVGMFLVKFYFSNIIRQLWNISAIYNYSWAKDFFELLWRYAISWSCGYFIFQLYTPLAFSFQGAVEAGKVGISIALWTAGFSIANIWIVSITPKMNMLVAGQRWRELDSLFFKNLLISVGVYLLGSCCFFFIYINAVGKYEFFNRLISLKSMLILAFCWFVQLIANSLAVYLRAHKKEPLVMISFFSAFFIATTTYMCARYLDENWLFFGYFLNQMIGILFIINIFNKQRRKHNE